MALAILPVLVGRGTGILFMKIVSILAHQDDECMCLGTMLKCQARGDSVAFITTTDGSNGMVQTPHMPRTEAAAIRQREMSALAAAVGGEYINLAVEDEFLFDTKETRLALIEAIRRTRPDVIFTHYHEDYNADHTNTTHLVRHCAMLASLTVLPTASPSLAEHPAIFMIPPTGPVAFPGTHFVDITEQVDRKAELLALHESQEKAMFLALKQGLGEYTRVADAYYGWLVGCKYAEAFIPMTARGAIKPYSVLP